MIEIRYLNKNGNGVYQDAKSMEEAELIAQEMNRKGFQNVMIVNDGKDSWETYKKWLKRSLDLTAMAENDNNATPQEKMAIEQKRKTFQLCFKKMKKLGNKIKIALLFW